jgi:hypothetical protein
MLASWRRRTEAAFSSDLPGLPDLGTTAQLAGEGVSTADPSRSSETSTRIVGVSPRAAGRTTETSAAVTPSRQSRRRRRSTALFLEPDPFGQAAGGRLVVDLDLLRQGALETVQDDGIQALA